MLRAALDNDQRVISLSADSSHALASVASYCANAA
jgi:hypothetical protein